VLTRFNRGMGKPVSVIAWLACVLPALFTAVMGLVIAPFMGLEWGLFMGGGACLFAGLMILPAPLLMWLVKRVASGNGNRYVEQIAAQVGGRAEVGSLLWAYQRPALDGSIDGVPFSLFLIRMAGLLAPADPGRSRLLFSWMSYLDVPVRIPGYVAFAPPETADRGMSILGLNGSMDGPGIKMFWGDERGRALLDDARVQAAARALVEAGAHDPPLVRVGPDGLKFHGKIQVGAGPEQLVAAIRAAVALAGALHAAGEPAT